MKITDGPDYECTWPIDDKQNEQIKKFIPSLIKGKEFDYFISNSNLIFILKSCFMGMKMN